ncbi:MAG: helix-turn-helix domain-containing protein [Novosphingobium sp.]|nr:helix-turn-helix domain-containing protein [Novosphingobium sp.]
MNPNGRQSTATQASDQWFDRAKDRLEEKGMILKDFAMAIGITPGGAGHYLSGRRQPTPAMLKKIADVLDMTPNHLISGLGMDDSESQAELTAAPGFAERLRQATALAGFSDERGWQQRIAEELGVKNQAIGQWMRGETLPSTSMMLKIARRFGVTLDWLLLNRVDPSADMDKAIAKNYDPSVVRRVVAENVMRIRQEHGISQTVLGGLAGVGQTTISSLEDQDGKSPTLETLSAVGFAYGLPEWTLLVDESTSKNYALIAALSPAHRQQALRMLTAFTASLRDPS